MPASITISADQFPQATARLARLQALGGTLRPLLTAAAGAVAREIRTHLRTKNAQPNARGWPKQGFYGREAQAVAVGAVSDTEARVDIASPALAHRYLGGTITPKRGRALTIPATAEAYAAGAPREGYWGDRLFRPKGKRYLATKDGDTITVQYFLARSVTHQPDPSVLPADARLNQVATTALESALNRQLRRLEAN